MAITMQVTGPNGEVLTATAPTRRQAERRLISRIERETGQRFVKMHGTDVAEFEPPTRFAEAKAVLAHLPGPGESLHAVVTARLDLTDVINAVIERIGRCERMLVATLGYNQRNLKTILAWLDTGAVGSLSLVASLFFRSHNGEMWMTTLEEFRQRGQRAACCHSHAKVVTLAFATGERLSIEGSANLCGSGSAREQFALIHDAGLHDFHASWIAALLDKHEGRADD